MIKTFTIEKDQKPSEVQICEVEEAKKHPIVFDEDSPELSPAMVKAFQRVDIQRKGRECADRGV